MMYRKTAAGFTLIELMIVVVIIGILAAFAYPAYQDSVTKSRRSDGVSMINQVLQAQERYFTENMTYSTDLTDLGYGTAGNVASQEGFYQVSAAVCGAGIAINSCVLVTAVPQGLQAGDGNLSLNSRGTKTGPW